MSEQINKKEGSKSVSFAEDVVSDPITNKKEGSEGLSVDEYIVPLETHVVNQITLDCLLNKEQYAKYLNSTMKKSVESNKKERKFYKKRILQLTRDMLSSEEMDITSDMLYAFDHFTRTCISYFKMMDRTDILQTDYPPLDKNENEPIDEPFLLEESNKSIMRSIKLKPITMDKFVKRISNVVVEKQFIPLLREVNLKDPDLRNKGIRKKKNVDTLYGDKTKENETIMGNETETKNDI